MNCEECDKPLDVSATKPNYLRCRSCRLLFVVNEQEELRPFAIQAPDGADEDEFFASFCGRLGFEDDEDAGAAPSAPQTTPSGGGGGGLVWIGILVLLAAVGGVVYFLFLRGPG